MADVKPLRIAQVAVSVEALDRAKSFYGEVLGLTHLFDAPPGLSFFQCGETRLMLSEPEGAAAGSSILYYGVEDVTAAYESMREKGAAFEEAPKCIAKVDGRDIWLAIGRDSEGSLFGLISG
jgi:methylmalonyl-CoA/ethylmalonyl-CoA epimerase